MLQAATTVPHRVGIELILNVVVWQMGHANSKMASPSCLEAYGASPLVRVGVATLLAAPVEVSLKSKTLSGSISKSSLAAAADRVMTTLNPLRAHFDQRSAINIKS